MKKIFLFLYLSTAIVSPVANSADALYVDENGNIGMGTNTPDGALHVSTTGHVLGYLQSSDNNAVQLRFRSDSGNRRFLAVDANNVPETQIVFAKSEIQFSGPTNTNDLWMTIDATGITTTGAGACNPGPCDLVFDPKVYKVESIEEHSAYMWKNKHLWGVGPTEEGQPVNLTKKTTGILHELEKAHIYIEHLHIRLKKAEKYNNDLQGRLEMVEEKLWGSSKDTNSGRTAAGS